MIREVVNSGKYASASDLMRDAIREWSTRRIERAKALGELGRFWDEGIASGPTVEGEDAFVHIQTAIDAVAHE